MNTFNAYAITTGDTDGIGFEVTAKALHRIGPRKNAVFFIYRHKSQEKKQPQLFRLIDQKFSRFTFHSIKQAMAFYLVLQQTNALSSKFVFDIALNDAPPFWVLSATELCKSCFFKGLITAPISKTIFKEYNLKFVGHTGVFRHYFPKNDLFMGFIGKKFSVLLATDHISIGQIEKNLTIKKIRSVLQASLLFKNFISSAKPIGLLGLNPHAGEKGILGSFEQKNLAEVFKQKKISAHFSKPLSPDAAFFKSNWSLYSFYLAWYHDQGLIPFKLVHGQESGVHITIGLPFIRTSVDHGTAKDIFNLNRANAQSMVEAVTLNLKLTQD